MPRISSSCTGVLLCTFVCSISFALSLLTADGPAATPVERSKKIEQLIDRLAEKRADVAGRKDVFQAADELLELGTEAFPQLIDHFGDSRRSFDEDDPTSENVYHRSVGQLCYRLVVDQVRKYRPWNIPDPRGTPGWSGSIVPNNAKEWWEANKGKALWELQADSVRRVIAENKDPKWFKFDSEERHKLADEAIRANEELLKQLTESKTPLPTTPIRPWHDK
jgi:hypothetical protein